MDLALTLDRELSARTSGGCVDDDVSDSGEGPAFRGLIEAGGPPSRKGASRGVRNEPPRRHGHDWPADGERCRFAERTGRRHTRQSRITARGGVQTRIRRDFGRLGGRGGCGRGGCGRQSFGFAVPATARRPPAFGAALAKVRVNVVVGGEGRRRSDRGSRRFRPTPETKDHHGHGQEPADEPVRLNVSRGKFHAVAFIGGANHSPCGTVQTPRGFPRGEPAACGIASPGRFPDVLESIP